MIGEDRLIQARADVTPVKTIMLKDPVSIMPEQSLHEAISLMRQRRVDSLLVTDKDNKLLGLVDIETLNNNYKKDLSVGDILNKVNFYLEEDQLLRDTAHRILKRGLKYVPVVDKEHHLKGIVTRASLVDMLYDIIWGSQDTEDTL